MEFYHRESGAATGGAIGPETMTGCDISKESCERVREGSMVEVEVCLTKRDRPLIAYPPA